MTRHIFIFIVFFLVGAVVTTVIRTSRHQPYAMSVEAQPMSDATSSSPTKSAPAMTAVTTPMSIPPKTATPASTAPINTICAICGMPVNPALPTAIYQGKVIGFGCKACPARFAKDPEKFGPAALANQVVEDK